MKKAITIVLTLALCLTMCIGLASCSNGGETNSAPANHYEVKINSLSEYSAEKSIPVKLGQGSGVFGFDGWILTGTKTPVDDNTGEATDAYWTLTLDVEDSVNEVIDYTFGLNYYAAPSSAYTQPIKAQYTFTGKGYAVDGGYHLFTPTYAETTITGQCMEETPGWRADTGEALTAVAPDGSKLFFYYTNSNLQLSGYEFGFPLNGNLVASMFECDFMVKDGEITEFKNVTENLSDLAVPSNGPAEGGSGGDDAGSGGPEA